MSLRPLPALQDNYIWLLADEAGRALVVDPGDAAPVLAASAGLDLVAVLLTHHHPDHIAGTAALLVRWPRAVVFAPEDERIPEPCQRIADGERIEIGPWTFDAVAVPGHTRSHIAYVGEGLLFCGDTLFSLGCGRLFEGTPAQMHASLSRLAALPADTSVCCGHEYTEANARFALAVEPGNRELREHADAVRELRANGHPSLPSTLELERACNPFLRVDAPEIRASLATRLGRDTEDAVDAFAALRAWKDVFRG
ncbi:hydroxyacylglutathione hydrolase [Pseudoluteimonas lycopersici]|uniref:Hydroxyacylglutathione hydrolase n=1 Tax=Pseudoluteimonas lycopersici TaxID=1324796 RepID=A0A516V249_9GAMM|nr:hydroxyacylglutathione hydrolase [Lysobacter lycopersici]QDQ72590.1 hydroxyacylglutathione hydrolase [Lysobacter lycopersici]